MKTSIIFLGLVVLSFNNLNAANDFKSQDLDQQELATLNVEITKQENQLVFINQEFLKVSVNNSETETIIFDPQTVIKISCTKTVEGVIAENKLITECKGEIFQALSFEKTTEDSIIEDNLIIESEISNEFFPLDFEKINRSVKSLKVNNPEINIDLKL